MACLSLAPIPPPRTGEEQPATDLGETRVGETELRSQLAHRLLPKASV
jgi:hypothetical protein